MNEDVKKVVARILKDIQVEMSDEFDKNFERQAFFSEKWQRRKSPIRDEGRAILTDTGALRKSIGSRTTENSITFFTTLPYAAIHNDGGEIVVTGRMKRFFWHKYYEATGAFGRRKDGRLRKDKRNARLDTEADFWMFMALKKAGSTIKIPRRRFLGTSPEVEKAVREIVEENLTEYFTIEYNIIRNEKRTLSVALPGAEDHWPYQAHRPVESQRGIHRAGRELGASGCLCGILPYTVERDCSRCGVPGRTFD